MSPSHTILLCTLSAGTGGNKFVNVSVDGQTTFGNYSYQGTFQIVIRYQVPTITAIYGVPVGTAGGLITLYGTNFGTDATLITPLIVNQQCYGVTVLNDHTVIQCTAPAGTGQNRSISITVDGLQNSITTVTLDYAGMKD